MNEGSRTLLKGKDEVSEDLVGAGLSNVKVSMSIGLQINIPKFHIPNSVFVCALGRHIMDKITYIRRSPA